MLASASAVADELRPWLDRTQHVDDINMYDSWVRIVHRAARRHVRRTRGDTRGGAFWSATLNRLLRERAAAKNKYKHKKDLRSWVTLQRSRAKVKLAIKKSKKTGRNEHCDECARKSTNASLQCRVKSCCDRTRSYIRACCAMVRS